MTESTNTSKQLLNLPFDEQPRACRIVCTLGPASSTPEIIRALLQSGMNVARLNFSHGTHETHAATVKNLRASSRLGWPVAILQDLQGHKVRVGTVVDTDGISLVEGDEVLVGAGDGVTRKRIGVDYPNVTRHVGAGHRLFLDDAQIELEVTGMSGEDLACRVSIGGVLKSRKGAIFPDSQLEFPLINEKDLCDARFGVELGVDLLAMSFVRSAVEVRELRRHLAGWGEEKTRLIAKIEDRDGVDNLDEILDAADGVLIARGDLGVTLPREKVPGLQKSIIRKANRLGVPVITATQMLESMTFRDKPTRAEVNDVHGAVLDGSDAVMLSGETAAGRYPIQSVQEMDRICREAQSEINTTSEHYRSPARERNSLYDKMAASAAAFADDLGARCILSFSLGGGMLKALSAARPRVPVYGAVVDQAVLRSLLIHRGITVAPLPPDDAPESRIAPKIRKLRPAGAASPGDRVVVVARKRQSGAREAHYLALVILE